MYYRYNRIQRTDEKSGISGVREGPCQKLRKFVARTSFVYKVEGAVLKMAFSSTNCGRNFDFQVLKVSTIPRTKIFRVEAGGGSPILQRFSCEEFSKCLTQSLISRDFYGRISLEISKSGCGKKVRYTEWTFVIYVLYIECNVGSSVCCIVFNNYPEKKISRTSLGVLEITELVSNLFQQTSSSPTLSATN